MKQNRWKSKYTWLAFSALALFLLKNYGMLDNIGFTETSFAKFVELALAAGVAAGILNNPSDANKF